MLFTKARDKRINRTKATHEKLNTHPIVDVVRPQTTFPMYFPDNLWL